MSDVNEVVENVEVPEIEVEVAPSATDGSKLGIQLPTAQGIGQTMVNTAAGIICGAVLNMGIQATISGGKKLVGFAKKKIDGAIETRKELKTAENTTQEEIPEKE